MNYVIRSLFYLGLFLPLPAIAGLDVFAKGNVSKSHISRDKWEISVSATTGIGISLFSGFRLEGRYTNISSLQNLLVVGSDESSIRLTDIKTQTTIYSLGLDIDLLGETSPFQPFIYVGVGYIQTERSYYAQVAGAGTASYILESPQKGYSGNLGLGFRIKIARSLAFETEVFAYGIDIDKPDPLVNLYGTVGVRLVL